MGSEYAVGYFKRNLNVWIDVFDLDEKDMIFNSNPVADDDSFIEGYSLLPKKLPATLELMSYEELWKWISLEILKEHWKNGGKEKYVRFGREDFSPSFWINEIWEWSSVTKHYKDLTKKDFPGDGNMTDFLKNVVKKRLEMLGISVSAWVSKAFSDEDKKKRLRTRKVFADTDINEEETEVEANQFLTVEIRDNAVRDELPTELVRSRNSEVDSINNESTSTRRSARLADKRTASSLLSTITSTIPTAEAPPAILSPLSSHSTLQEPSTSAVSNRNVFIPRRRQNIPSEKKALLLPSDLVARFEAIAQINTQNGVELGGVLAGIDAGEHFAVTDLLIPRQICFADRYDVHDEHQISDFFENRGKVLLGLIHTHPRMTSFLSSVDLHALNVYAVDNRSIISVVVSPEKRTSPAFSLTAKGIDVLRRCNKDGFHTHRNAKSLYEEASHVSIDDSLNINVNDFRLMSD